MDTSALNMSGLVPNYVPPSYDEVIFYSYTLHHLHGTEPVTDVVPDATLVGSVEFHSAFYSEKSDIGQ